VGRGGGRGQKWTMDIRNLIYERVRLVKQGRLVWFLFLETNIGEAFAPLRLAS